MEIRLNIVLKHCSVYCKLFLIFSPCFNSVLLQFGAIIIDHLSVACNEKIYESNTTLFNDGVNDTVFNVYLHFLTDVQKVRADLELYTPEDKSDEKCRRLFFRTSIDGEKMLKGINGNYITKTIMANFLQSLDIVPVFPILKVTKCYFHA